VLGERLLSLLLEEPAPAEFARRLEEIEEQAGDAQPARRQVQVARDVRTLLDRYRRRAGELAVLYDTANFLNIRLALGIGLGGLVAQAAKPGPGDRVTLTGADGDPVTLAPGSTWVELVLNRGGAVTTG
jgi:hypothetical protein